ncbi:MAG: YceI family protein [Vicinamibacterales bacterium]
MAIRPLRFVLTALVALGASTPLFAQGLALDSARVTLNGTSNVHAWTAVSDAVTLTTVKVAAADGDVFDAAMKPGGLEAFEISIPVTSVKSPKGDLDKNMHKALMAEKHPAITFALSRLEPGAAPDTYTATGVLTIAGTAKEVPLALTVARTGAGLKVTGSAPLVMTEFGVVPPKAMLGMLKTDPKVTVTFEALLQTR